MPVIESTYNSPYYFFSGHLQTILPALFRKVGNIAYERERIITPDKDFLDLDWSGAGSDKLAIISHGLEGDSQRPYVKGMVRTFNKKGWDVLAWNYRGCSGEANKICRSYHSGETNDLDYVIRYVLKKNKYPEIVLIGFSIGGNITLKYLGEQGENILPEIKASVCFSVPCHLESAAKHLSKLQNRIYLNRFLNSLRKKLNEKSKLIPGMPDLNGIDKIRDFFEFDERFTAPMNGFKSAHDYWEKSSSIFFIEKIRIPTLLVNAKNDPFLPPECFPVNEAERNPFFFLEIPSSGGHCGFYERNEEGTYWSEKRAVEFVRKFTVDNDFVAWLSLRASFPYSIFLCGYFITNRHPYLCLPI
jgi:predicted alpha/beta-fold hydrolase